MANTQVSKSASAPQRRVPDVFDALHGELNRVFRNFERSWPRWPGLPQGAAGDIAVPNIDVHENANVITVEADLPGLDEKDVSVTLANGVLTIRGERKSEREEKDESYYLSERSIGSFERSLRLPDTVDESNIEARFDKGVLKVVAAKKPGAGKAEKKIQIKKG